MTHWNSKHDRLDFTVGITMRSLFEQLKHEVIKSPIITEHKQDGNFVKGNPDTCQRDLTKFKEWQHWHVFVIAWACLWFHIPCPSHHKTLIIKDSIHQLLYVVDGHWLHAWVSCMLWNSIHYMEIMTALCFGCNQISWKFSSSNNTLCKS